MTNPDYTYSFREHKGRQVLVIEDTSPTGFFVKDNLDNVVNGICKIEDVWLCYVEIIGNER